MSASFDLSDPTRVTVGTVGPPGGRTFYLQARQDDVLVTLKLEKQQVVALAELLGELLSDLPTPGAALDPATLKLEEPVLADWVVGSMQLAYDQSTDRVVLISEELLPGGVTTTERSAEEQEEQEEQEEGAGDPEGAIGRLAFTREQAAALVAQGEALVSAGRPACPLCGYPMDPAGHSCPKTNGHRAPSL